MRAVQTDIQNYYGNSTYMSLMEHLKALRHPEITTISEYYPYGAPIASRSYSIVEYRYVHLYKHNRAV